MRLRRRIKEEEMSKDKKIKEHTLALKVLPPKLD